MLNIKITTIDNIPSLGKLIDILEKFHELDAKMEALKSEMLQNADEYDLCRKNISYTEDCDPNPDVPAKITNNTLVDHNGNLYLINVEIGEEGEPNKYNVTRLQRNIMQLLTTK